MIENEGEHHGQQREQKLLSAYYVKFSLLIRITVNWTEIRFSQWWTNTYTLLINIKSSTNNSENKLMTFKKCCPTPWHLILVIHLREDLKIKKYKRSHAPFTKTKTWMCCAGLCLSQHINTMNHLSILTAWI